MKLWETAGLTLSVRELLGQLAGIQEALLLALDTGVRGGPEPDSVTLEAFGMDIPEA